MRFPKSSSNALESPPKSLKRLVAFTLKQLRPGLAWIEGDFEVVINAYREVLSIESQGKDRGIRLDALQRLHAYHNLDEALRRVKEDRVFLKGAKIGATLRDDGLLETRRRNAPSTSHNVREASTTRSANYRWRRPLYRNRLISRRQRWPRFVVDLRFRRARRRTTKRRICSHACLGCSTGNGKIRRHRSIVSMDCSSRWRAIWTPLKPCAKK